MTCVDAAATAAAALSARRSDVRRGAVEVDIGERDAMDLVTAARAPVFRRADARRLPAPLPCDLKEAGCTWVRAALVISPSARLEACVGAICVRAEWVEVEEVAMDVWDAGLERALGADFVVAAVAVEVVVEAAVGASFSSVGSG